MKRSVYRKSRAFCLILFLTVISITQAQNHHKPSKSELENKRKRIKDEISQINSMLRETKENRKNSIGDLVKINVKLQKRKELIATISTEIASLETQIQQTEHEIARLKASLAKLKAEYARMMVLAQRNQDSYSGLMFIVSAGSFSQAYARMKYMQQYAGFRRKQADEIVRTQEAIIARLKELQSQRHEKNVLLGHEEKEKQTLAGEKNEKESMLAVLQKKEQQLKADLEKRRQDEIQLQLAIKKLIEAEIKRKLEEAAKAEAARALARKAAAAKASKKAKKPVTRTETNVKTETPADTRKERPTLPELDNAAVALSEDFSNNRGKLPWPVAKGVICESYGEHEHPAIKGFMMFNSGVEICATRGTQARAVFDGEVTGIAVSPTGGKLVIIRHGEYLSVYSNLDDVMVKTGQKVTVKQTIGTVIYDEGEGKTSMNLQIWKGQKTMDPAGWLLNARQN